MQKLIQCQKMQKGNHRMIWGIIGALPSEIALLKAQMVDAKEEIVSGLTYQSGRKRWRCDIMWIIGSIPAWQAAPATI